MDKFCKIFTIFGSTGPLTDVQSMPASLATALAKKVFPQPGDSIMMYVTDKSMKKFDKFIRDGPHNKTPEGLVSPTASNCSACRISSCK